MATAFSNFPDASSATRAQAAAQTDMRLQDAAERRALEDRLTRLLQSRRRRVQFFPEALFADPAWDILLELSLAELQQRRVSISSLCFSAAVPQTTALRWIKSMTSDGLLVRRDDPLDARRTFVELAPSTSQKMLGYLRGLDVIQNIGG